MGKSSSGGSEKMENREGKPCPGEKGGKVVDQLSINIFAAVGRSVSSQADEKEPVLKKVDAEEGQFSGRKEPGSLSHCVLWGREGER